jgi:S1-C subfamily serine protease
VKRTIALVALALVAAGCASGAPARSDLIGELLKSTAQLRAEREGGALRAASGVVLATDPSTRRAWILTARHVFDPPHAQQVYVRLPGRETVVGGTIAFVSRDLDIAIIEAQPLDVRPVRLKVTTRLGDEVLVIAFPWGQSFTVVRGVVSQVTSSTNATLVSGSPQMIDASVSYGSSGGGVFDAHSGELVAIVEGHRTVKVTIPEVRDRPLELPVAGETTLIAASAILRFLVDSGLTDFLPK